MKQINLPMKKSFLEFIRKRVSKQDDSDPDEVSYGAYKSQQHRPLDVQ